MKLSIILLLCLIISACATNKSNLKRISINDFFDKKTRNSFKHQTKAYARIKRIWLSMADHTGKESCHVNIKISKTGEIISYKPIKCPNEKRIIKTLEKASPLPGYGDGEVYISSMDLQFSDR